MQQIKVKFDVNRLHKEIPELVDIQYNVGEASCVDDAGELVLLFANGKQISIFYNSSENCIVVEPD